MNDWFDRVRERECNQLKFILVELNLNVYIISCIILAKLSCCKYLRLIVKRAEKYLLNYEKNSSCMKSFETESALLRSQLLWSETQVYRSPLSYSSLLRLKYRSSPLWDSMQFYWAVRIILFPGIISCCSAWDPLAHYQEIFRVLTKNIAHASPQDAEKWLSKNIFYWR